MSVRSLRTKETLSFDLCQHQSTYKRTVVILTHDLLYHVYSVHPSNIIHVIECKFGDVGSMFFINTHTH